MGIKALGGVRTLADAYKMIEAGATQSGRFLFLQMHTQESFFVFEIFGAEQ